MKKVELQDILKYKYPEKLEFNPSGSAYAYHIATADEEKNTYKRNVWLVKDGKPFQLTSTLDATISFWDDDETLILNRKNPDDKFEGTELYSISTNGGEAKLWARFKIGLGGFDKLGENLYIATGEYEVDDPDAYKDDDETRAKKKEEKEKNVESDYEVWDEVPYWMNGAGVINGKKGALFLLERDPSKEDGDPEQFKITRITDSDVNVQDFSVEGDKVVFLAEKNQKVINFFSKLYIYDVKTRKIEALYDGDDMGCGGYFYKNGETYVFSCDYRSRGINETTLLYKVENNKLVKVDGYKPDYSRHNSIVGDVMVGGGKNDETVVEDGKVVLYTIETIEDHAALARIELATGKTDIVLDLPGSIYFFDISDEKIVLAYGDEESLTEIYEISRKDLVAKELGNPKFDKPLDTKAVLKKVSSHNDENLKDVYVAKPNRIDYNSEGLDLHGWVLLPENYDEKKSYPAILDVHGGPRCVYSELFFHEMQYWVAKGFVVMYTNIKGSDGRGDEFADIRGDYGGTDFKNLMDFVDACLEKYPAIDDRRLCETGGSYGGFMTNWIIGHTDRFCAAASQRSISNWISMTYISDIGTFFGPDQCGIAFDDWFGKLDEKTLWKHSPLAYVDNVKTPTLFLHSDEDYRCPLAEGMQMMQAIRVRGVETRMIVFHGENHELSRSGKPKHRIRRLNEITEWFEKHI